MRLFFNCEGGKGFKQKLSIFSPRLRNPGVRPVPVVGDNNQIKYGGSRPRPTPTTDIQGSKDSSSSSTGGKRPAIDYQGWYTEGDTIPPLSGAKRPTSR